MVDREGLGSCTAQGNCPRAWRTATSRKGYRDATQGIAGERYFMAKLVAEAGAAE